MKTIKIGKWILRANSDNDGHLNLTIEHKDGSAVCQIGEEISAKLSEWGDRFTTESIESNYLSSIK